jgi:hypothetical protein
VSQAKERRVEETRGHALGSAHADVSRVTLDELVCCPLNPRGLLSVDLFVDVQEDFRPGVDRTTEHNAVETLKQGASGFDVPDPTVQDDRKFGKPFFQTNDAFPTQRGDGPVATGIESTEPSVTGMHEKRPATGLGEVLDEAIEGLFTRIVVEAETTLDADGTPRCPGDGTNDGGDPGRFVHEASAEVPTLDPVARTADVDVHTVVRDEATSRFRGPGGRLRIARTQLKENRRLSAVPANERFGAALEESPIHDHLRDEPGSPAEDSEHVTKGMMRNTHHRGHDEARR